MLATGALILIALGLRLWVIGQLQGTPPADVLLIDSETYDRFARLILAGEFRGEEIYSMNVLYPYFLAGVYRVFGTSVQAVCVVQAVLDAISVGLIVMLGQRLFDRRVGLLAGGLAAVYGPFVFYTTTLLTPTLINFLCLCALNLLARELDRPRTWVAVAAGLCIGLAALGRGNSLLFVPLLLVVFRVARGRWRPALAEWLLVAGGAFSLIVAVGVRNYLVEGRMVPIAANYAAFYIGHNPDATGLYVLPTFTESADFEGEVMGTVAAISEIVGRPLTLAETARWLFDEGVAYAVANPGAEVALSGRKLFFFWNRIESPTNLNFYFARDFSSVLRALPLHFGWVAPLGLLGLFLTRRDWRRLLLLHAYGIVYVATGVLFFVSAEYRMPIVPVMMLFAAVTVFWLWDQARAAWGSRTRVPLPRRLVAIGGWLAVLLVLALACNLTTPLLRAQTLKRVDYLNFGKLYTRRGDHARAGEMLERSIAIDPRFGPAYDAMAELEHRQGRDLEALRWQELASRYRVGGQYRDQPTTLDPTSGLLRETAGLYEAGEYERALRGFGELHELYRESGRGEDAVRMLNNVGLCQYKLRRLDAAAQSFRAVIGADSTYVYGYTNLARVLALRGQDEEAMALFEKALALDPDNPRVRRGYDAFRRRAPADQP